MNKKLLQILWMDDRRIKRWGRWYVGINLISGVLVIVGSLLLYLLFQSSVTTIESETIQWLNHLASHLEPESTEYQHVLEIQPVASALASKASALGALFSFFSLALGVSFLLTSVLIQRLREVISEPDGANNIETPLNVTESS